MSPFSSLKCLTAGSLRHYFFRVDALQTFSLGVLRFRTPDRTCPGFRVFRAPLPTARPRRSACRRRGFLLRTRSEDRRINRCRFPEKRKPGGGTPGFALCRKFHYVEKAFPTAGGRLSRFSLPTAGNSSTSSGKRRASPVLMNPPRSLRFPFRESFVPFSGPPPDSAPQFLPAPACRSRLPADLSAHSPSRRTTLPLSPLCRGKTPTHSLTPIEQITFSIFDLWTSSP